MITDEMVEKAADAIRGGLPRAGVWNEVAREIASAALEAAWSVVEAEERATSTSAMKAAVELEIHSCLGIVPTSVIGEEIQKAIDAETVKLIKALDEIATLEAGSRAAHSKFASAQAIANAAIEAYRSSSK